MANICYSVYIKSKEGIKWACDIHDFGLDPDLSDTFREHAIEIGILNDQKCGWWLHKYGGNLALVANQNGVVKFYDGRRKTWKPFLQVE